MKMLHDRSVLQSLASALAIVCALASTSCAVREPHAAVLDHTVLLDADRAFAVDASARRLQGWMDWFTEDAIKLDLIGDEVRGLEAIRKADAPLWDDPTLTLRWAPDVGGWLEPGFTGYTRGRYTLDRANDSGESTIGTGTYLTLWRKTPAGWRVTFDMGIPDA